MNDFATDVGANNGERPVVVFADSAGRNVSVFRCEVRAVIAALASPVVTFLEVDLVVTAIACPDLENTLDVHLGDFRLRDAVLRLEELFEDCVIERL